MVRAVGHHPLRNRGQAGGRNSVKTACKKGSLHGSMTHVVQRAGHRVQPRQQCACQVGFGAKAPVVVLWMYTLRLPLARRLT